MRQGADTWSVPFLMAETPYLPDGNPVLFLNSKNTLFLVWHAAVLKVRTSVDYSGEGAPEWAWQDNIFLNPGNDFAEEVAEKLQAALRLTSEADAAQKKPSQRMTWKF